MSSPFLTMMITEGLGFETSVAYGLKPPIFYPNNYLNIVEFNVCHVVSGSFVFL